MERMSELIPWPWVESHLLWVRERVIGTMAKCATEKVPFYQGQLALLEELKAMRDTLATEGYKEPPITEGKH
mgnify:CR=1 FL=1